MKRWIVWTLVAALAVLLAFFPLRIAIEAADLPRFGLTARNVSGSLWDGRIGDLALQRQALGTFDVRLRPGPLFFGNASMHFERVEDLQGALYGTLLSSGGANGIRSMTGRIPAGNLFAPIPVEALEFKRLTVIFKDKRCVEANGQVTAIVGTRVGGLDLTEDLTGAVTCENNRVRARLASDGGRQQVEFFLAGNGQYRAFMTVRGVSPEVGVALSLLGFRGGPGGLTISMSGRL